MATAIGLYQREKSLRQGYPVQGGEGGPWIFLSLKWLWEEQFAANEQVGQNFHYQGPLSAKGTGKKAKHKACAS